MKPRKQQKRGQLYLLIYFFLALSGKEVHCLHLPKFGRRILPWSSQRLQLLTRELSAQCSKINVILSLAKGEKAFPFTVLQCLQHLPLGIENTLLDLGTNFTSILITFKFSVPGIYWGQSPTPVNGEMDGLF